MQQIVINATAGTMRRWVSHLDDTIEFCVGEGAADILEGLLESVRGCTFYTEERAVTTMPAAELRDEEIAALAQMIDFFSDDDNSVAKMIADSLVELKAALEAARATGQHVVN